MGETTRAAEYGARSVTMYERLGDPRGHANAELNLATICLDLGDFDRAAEQLGRLRATYRSTGNVDGEASTIMGFCTIAERRGCSDEARAHARSVLTLLPAQVARSNRIYAQAAVLALAADPDAATLDALAELVEEARDLNDATVTADVLCQLGILAASLGRPTEAIGHFEAALAVARLAGERHYVIEAQAGLAAARCAVDPGPDRLVE